MTIKSLALVALLAATSMSSGAQAANLISNGQFSDGLAGWSIYTMNGTAGRGDTPRAETFDVTGNGAQSAAALQVGSAVVSNYGGGGLFQQFVSRAGSHTFSADFASFGAGDRNNADGGLFSVLIDGQTLASYTVNSINPGQTIRSSFSFTTDLAAGTHNLQLQALRQYLNISVTPLQLYTNVVLDNGVAGAVPEPASWALMIGGFGLAAGGLRRRHNVRTTIAYA